jgi:hypothetical protein
MTIRTIPSTAFEIQAHRARMMILAAAVCGIVRD